MGRVVRHFSFTGRTTRVGFWQAWLFNSVLASLAWGLAVAAMINAGPLGGWLMLLLAPATIANLAVSIRRLHDRAKSGWWLVPFQILPVALAWVGNFLVKQDGAPPLAGIIALICLLAALALLIWGLVEIGFLPSKSGGNRYAA